jgi:hypothetical protein
VVGASIYQVRNFDELKEKGYTISFDIKKMTLRSGAKSILLEET